MINYHDTYHDEGFDCLDLRGRLCRFSSFSVKRREGSLLAGQLLKHPPFANHAAGLLR